jgi:hypothetical protein
MVVAPNDRLVAGELACEAFETAVYPKKSLLVIAVEVVQAPNDKQQIAPMLEKIEALPEQLGRPDTLLADNGYFSEANVTRSAANVEPLIATGRQPILPLGANDLLPCRRRRKT